ncbi:MAG: GNAT family N-acetyltransferase [Thiotrichales bacterium]|nr:GNAT family N-acetyltransferase [Thiotrichales bacterium]|tara:strand:+ start:292 stop:744 length:453 start_codon:yes stop_codon:yes gene_type:complete
MTEREIRVLSPESQLKPRWRELYNGYATFYKREMTDQIAENVWSWITSPAHELDGILVSLDGEPVGLAHFRRMPSPLRGADIGFLDDMFIDPVARGSGVAEVMFDHLRATARDRGWEIIRWITADNNYRARGLYDRVATKSIWNTYEMKV